MNEQQGAPHGTAPAVARLRGIHKQLGRTRALQGLDLDVAAGEITALLGPNGAGKTTSVNILLGLRRPDAGEVALFDGTPTDPGRRRRVGWTPQQASFPATLSVDEVLRFVRAHHVDPLGASDVLERCLLTPLARRQCGGLSGGQTRRLAFALAIVGRPQLLVLDEPTAGLDMDAKRAVWDQIAGHQSAGGSVLLTTHDLDEADRIATRVAVIAGGRIVRTGTPAAVKSATGVARVEFETDIGDGFGRLPTVTRTDRVGRRITMWTADTDTLVRLLVASGVPFENLRVSPVSLEDAVAAALPSDDSNGA